MVDENNKNSNNSARNAYEIMFNNLLISKGKSIKSIVITSCKPNISKTDVAINLALSIADAEFKVLLVDADMRKPPNKYIHNEAMGLYDYLTKDISIEDVICESNIENLFYVNFGKANNKLSLLRSHRMEEFIRTASEKYDYIIYDTPSLATAIDASVIAPKTDGLILAAELGRTKIDSLRLAKNQLIMTNSKLLGVVLNKLKRGIFRSYKLYNNFDHLKKV